MAHIKELINQKISINLLYYISSVSLIFFILSKSDLSIYEFSKYELIIFILIFMVSVYFESKKENILLKILIIHCFIFYIIAIPYSIINSGASLLYARNINSSQLPESLLILCYQYFALFFSIYVINPTINYSSKKIRINEINFLFNFLIFLCVANLIFIIFGEIDYESYRKWFAIFFNIFNLTKIAFMFTILFFLVFVEKIKVNNLLLKSILFYTIYLISFSLQGSRSSILFLILILILCSVYYLNLKKLKILNLLTIFLLAIFSAIGFYISTVIRGYNYLHTYGTNNLYMKELNTFYDFTHRWITQNGFGTIWGLFDRISYFDFYLEKLINFKYYEQFINLSYYYKPLLDRITPGFELYNVPLATKILQDSFFKQYFIENYLGTIYNSTVTNSEQITIFAESHIVFGFYSIFYYFVIFYLLKILLNFFKKINNQIFLQILNMSILLLFFDWITGFGMDMSIMLTLYHFVFLIIIFFIFKAYLIFKK